MADQNLTLTTDKNQIWFEVQAHDRSSAFIHREILASSFSALAAGLTGDKREGVILAAIAAGLKVVRCDR